MRVVIFLGPSLPLDEARGLLDATYLPPAKQSDLLSAVFRYQPHIIGLVDGEFSQALSVWHKEILYALDTGVAVYGAASMGALRAVECEAFGMRGVGEIFRNYRDGALRGDDEVALQYAPAEAGYRHFSLPLVNIRATLEQGVAEGRIAKAHRDAFIRLAKSSFFADRTVDTLLETARQLNFTAVALESIRSELQERYVDLKRADALELLRTLAKLDSLDVPTGQPWRFNASRQYRQLENLDRKVEHAGVELSLARIAQYAALHETSYNELNFRAGNRALVQLLADLLDVEVETAAIDAEAHRFRKAAGLHGEHDFETWLAHNDLQEDDFRDLMREVGTCRHLQRWFNLSEPEGRHVRAVLNELRLRGDYPEVAARAASHEDLAKSSYPSGPGEATDRTLADLVAEQLQRSDWCLDTDCATWAAEAGFQDVAAMQRELLRAVRARRRATSVAREVARDLFSTTLSSGTGESDEPEAGDRFNNQKEQQ